MEVKSVWLNDNFPCYLKDSSLTLWYVISLFLIFQLLVMLHANNVTVHLQTNAQSVQAQTLDWSTVHAGLIILVLPTYQYMILMTIHAKTQFMIQIFLVPMELTTCSQANQTGLVVKLAMLVTNFYFLIILGYHCLYRGSKEKTQPCSGGFYCATNSTFNKPHPELAAQVDYFKTNYGGYCSPGSYCPSGGATGAPIDCDPGFYCPDYLMTQPNTKCSAGYYCSGKSKSPTPVDGTTGNICPAGKYCPEGSSSPTNCPETTYLSYTGAQSAQECSNCVPGFYCSGVGNAGPSGKCADGYYCPLGSTSAQAVECPIGSFCVSTTETGAQQPQVCPPGTYNKQTASTSCQSCSIGKYCENGLFDISCDLGSYCPGENRLIWCPIGTYNNKTDQSLISQCTNCAPGYSCEKTGIKQLTSLCDAGYICTGSTITPKPSNVT